MAQASSDGAETAQQGQPLLGQNFVEAAHESSKIQSNLIKRKPVPNATTVDYRPNIAGPPDHAGQGYTADHVYTKLESAQSLSPEEAAFVIDSREHWNNPNSDTNEVERLSGTPSGTPSAKSEKSDPIDKSRSHRPETWLPYGLRTWFLIPMMIIAIAFAAVCIGLMSYSRSHYGLGTDDGQNSVLFGWRFTPTLIAVLYVLGTAIVLSDVTRTETYARLSSPAWHKSQSTLCRVPGPWWDAYRKGLTTDDKKFNWTMLSAALLYTFGFLAIAPLSSSLLDSIGVTVHRPTTFDQIAIQQNRPLAFDPSQEVYLRTVAHTLQHLETSAWVTDEYAVLPFYPTSSKDIPLGPILTDQPQQWSAMTTVFKSVMTCEPMRLTETSASAYHQPQSEHCTINHCNDNYNYTYQSINVSDSNGCNLRIFSSSEGGYYYPNQLSDKGGGSWFIAPNFTFSVGADFSEAQMINFTEPCLGREVIFASTPWTFENPNPGHENWTVAGSALAANSTILSYSCDTKFYMANTTVLASSSGNQVSVVSFDDEKFRHNQAEIPSAVFDTTLFQRTILSSNWSSLLYRGFSDADPSTGGPLTMLSGVYGLDFGAMLDDSGFLGSASRFKQRFLGEMLLSAFNSLPADSRNTGTGQLIKNEQRIVVNSAVAITLTVLLLLSAGLFLLLFLISGLRRRPLGLTEDPSDLAVVASLALHDPVTRRLFIGIEGLSSQETTSVLTETRHRLSEGDLLSVGQRVALPSPSKHAKSWRPTAMKRRNGLGLLMFLCAMLATISALWVTYRGSGLYGSALLYRADFTIKNSTFALAPYSIVPTFLAVCLGLWWGSLEQTFRRIQPYVSMAKRPTSMRHGPFLSYVSSYLVWGAWKAASHRHWILALLCLGATFAEIFTVAMSALWQRSPGLIHEQVSVDTQFAMRDKSEVLVVESSGSGSAGNPVQAEVLASLYGSPATNWLYGATLQLAYNASEPAWSKDGWSFLPLDIQNVRKQAHDMTPDSVADQLLLEAALVNVTVSTTATRARLECSPFEGFSNLSAWLTEVHLTNSSRWNVSANPTDLKTGYELGTPVWDDYGDLQSWTQEMEAVSYDHRIQSPFFANPSRLQCCVDNRTDSFRPAGIGYWSPQTMIDGEDFHRSDLGGTRGPNFTTKWIHGFPHPKPYYLNLTGDHTDPSLDGHLIWRDVPRLTALNCKPILETAPAVVTVDRADESVESFKILKTPTPIGRPAWNDSYLNLGYVSAHPTAGTPQRTATSFGFLFLDAMLNAADLTDLKAIGVFGYPDYEPTSDRTFNFRAPGLNMDFMTYAMYSLAGNKLEALLDPDVQARTANKVFGTFFQHFVSSNISDEGTWTYQPVKDGTKVEAQVTRRVEMLQMNLTATAICLSILGFFVIVTIIVYFVDYKHFNNLQHDVDSMADVLRLVCDSPRFLTWLSSQNQRSGHKISGGRASMPERRKFPMLLKRNAVETGVFRKQDEPKVKLDMFSGTDGQMKWIVEIVDGDDGGRKKYSQGNRNG